MTQKPYTKHNMYICEKIPMNCGRERMIRNRVLYRRIWYIKKRNSKRIYFYSRVLSIIIILSLLFFYAEKNLTPYILESIEHQVRDEIKMEVRHMIGTVRQEGTIHDMVLEKIEDKLNSKSKITVKIPMQVFLKNSLIEKLESTITVRCNLGNNAKSRIETRYSDDVDGLKYCNTYLEVTTEVEVCLPVKKRHMTVKTTIPWRENTMQR